jgi:hypothetical protein
VTRANITDPAAAFTAAPDRACRDTDLDWHPGRGTVIDEHRAICARCPQLAPCREWGIRHERLGVWGGLGSGDRIRIRRQRGIALETPGHVRKAECGTNAGYQAHHGRGETACDACKEAHNLAKQHRPRRVA